MAQFQIYRNEPTATDDLPVSCSWTLQRLRHPGGTSHARGVASQSFGEKSFVLKLLSLSGTKIMEKCHNLSTADIENILKAIIDRCSC